MKKPRWCNLQIKIVQINIWKKVYKKKKRVTAPVLFENNQIELWCLVKRKTPTESTKLNVKSPRYTKYSEYKMVKPTESDQPTGVLPTGSLG